MPAPVNVTPKCDHPPGDEKRGCLMLRRHKGLTAAIAAAGTLLGLLGASSAAPALAAPAWRNHVCHGTPRNPGVLIGVNLNVIVHGVCLVNHGPVNVSHDVIILPNSALIAAFRRHGSPPAGSRHIYVRHGRPPI